MTETWRWAPIREIKKAAEELKGIIRASYPDARFNLERAPDDRHIWLLWTLVDVDDLDEVRTLTMEREAELLAEDHILLHVVPTQNREVIYGYQPQKVIRAG
jgi:hypothetical protein